MSNTKTPTEVFDSRSLSESDITAAVSVSDIRNITQNKIDTESYTENIEHLIGFKGFKEGVLLERWRTIGFISSRVIEITSEFIVLDCLLDKEKGIYEERIFSKSEFTHFDLKIGKLFKIELLARSGEYCQRFLNGEGNIPASDFPKIDFESRFGSSKLFRLKNG